MADHSSVLLPAGDEATPEALESISYGWRCERKTGWLGGTKAIVARRGEVVVTMKPVKVDNLARHLGGYVNAISEAAPEGAGERVLDGLRGMGLILSMTIRPGFDPEGECRRFIVGIARRFRGMVFAEGSFYDGNGALVLGEEGSPANYLSP